MLSGVIPVSHFSLRGVSETGLRKRRYLYGFFTLQIFIHKESPSVAAVLNKSGLFTSSWHLLPTQDEISRFQGSWWSQGYIFKSEIHQINKAFTKSQQVQKSVSWGLCWCRSVTALVSQEDKAHRHPDIAHGTTVALPQPQPTPSHPRSATHSRALGL